MGERRLGFAGVDFREARGIHDDIRPNDPRPREPGLDRIWIDEIELGARHAEGELEIRARLDLSHEATSDLARRTQDADPKTIPGPTPRSARAHERVCPSSRITQVGRRSSRSMRSAVARADFSSAIGCTRTRQRFDSAPAGSTATG